MQNQVKKVSSQQLGQQKLGAQPVVNQVKLQTTPVQTPPATPETPEKQMSILELLMNYSKENVELYKKQKAAKKNGQPQMQSAAATAVPLKKQPAQPGFAIPGQTEPVNKGLAIPGQTEPVNKGFATPGPQPGVQQMPVQRPPQPVPQKPQAPQPVQQPVVNRSPAFTQPPVPQEKSMNFGETVVLGGGGMGETMVLGATPVAQIKPYLIRAKNNEKINLDKPVFRIGKEKSFVDYFIGDNSAISRSHANIISREGEYFVVDTNSTNHTYVNGQMIQSNVETKISHGTKIRFANEDFEFKLY